MGSRRSLLVLLVSLALPSVVALPALAEPLRAVNSGNLLLSFDSATPGACSSVAITGLQAGEVLVGIDFRPAVPLGRLYALGSTGRLYQVNTVTGVATLVGAGGLPVTPGVSYGTDFSPTADRIRVVGDNLQNFRLNPDTGALLATDVPLSFYAGDIHAGQSPHVTAAAYTNNRPGVTQTLLYVIDYALDILAIQDPPNGGILHTVGGLGLNASVANGFDISPVTRTAYAAFNINLPPVTPILYTINLTSGLASAVGAIGCGGTVQGLSVVTTAVTGVEPGPSTALSLAAVPSVATTSTLLSLGIPIEASARIHVYDVTGRLVRSFDVPAGRQEQRWDLTDERGRKLASGVYLAQLRCAFGSATTRIAILP